MLMSNDCDTCTQYGSIRYTVELDRRSMNKFHSRLDYSPRRIVTCLNVVSVTNSKRLTTKLQRRIRKNSKYLILNPESNLDYEQEVARKPERRPSPARSVRSRSPASHSLARSAPFCISLHLSPHAQLSHATRITPHPACALPHRAPRNMPALESHDTCTARSSRI